MKILFALHIKHSSFWPSADVKPVSNSLVHACTDSASFLFLCVYHNIYAFYLNELKLTVRLRILYFTPLSRDTLLSRGTPTHLPTSPDECDQIGLNFDFWVTLGYFLLNKL
jgi:hypothetical protein